MKRLLLLVVVVALLVQASPLLAAFRICGTWRNAGSYCRSGTLYCKSSRTCQVISWIRGLPSSTYVTETREEACGSCAPGGGVIGR
jgi:hypothetical protein